MVLNFSATQNFQLLGPRQKDNFQFWPLSLATPEIKEHKILCGKLEHLKNRFVLKIDFYCF